MTAGEWRDLQSWRTQETIA